MRANPVKAPGRIAVAAVATALLTTAIGLSPPFLELEQSLGLSLLFRLRGEITPPDDVVIISASRESADQLGVGTDLTEWSRAWHADLLRKLTVAEASVVAFDIHFAEPREGPEDAALASAIGAGSAPPVVLLDFMQRTIDETSGVNSAPLMITDRRVKPIPGLLAHAAASVPFKLPVVPIRVDQYWTFIPEASDAPSLTAAALQLYLRDTYEPLREHVAGVDPELAHTLPASADELILAGALEQVMKRLRSWLLANEPARLAFDGDATRALLDLYLGPDSRYLNYYGPPGQIRTIPYHEALENDDPDLWRGKAIFVGYSGRTQPEQQDAFYSVYSQRSGLNLSGVEIAATAFGNLLDSTSLTPLAMPLQLVVLLVIGLAGGLLIYSLPTGWAALTGGVLWAAYGGLALASFSSSATWWPVVVPLLGQIPLIVAVAMIWNLLRAQAQREQIRHGAGLYLPDELVERFLHGSPEAIGETKLVTGTCLVTDAEEYTRLSERMSPRDLGQLLNAYLDVLFEIVQRHRGYVTDVVGDSIVVIWHSVDHETAALAAARSGIEMLSAVNEFNRQRDGRALPTRVGIHSGEFLLGTVGARSRFEFRAVGDTINSASRIEALNKRLGTRILVTKQAKPGTPDIVTREVGDFLVPGKELPLRVYELWADSGPDELMERFATALTVFRNERWDDAARAFELLTERFPSDGPSRFYRQLSERFRSAPPVRGATIEIETK